MVKISKKVNGTYYVVEAVADSADKKLHIVSAYMQTNSESINQELNIEQSSPQLTSETPLDPIASATDTIPSPNDSVKSGSGVIRAEKSGLPYDVVIERLPTEDTSAKLKANNDEIVNTVGETMGAAGKMTLNQMYGANADIQGGDAYHLLMGLGYPVRPAGDEKSLEPGLVSELARLVIYWVSRTRIGALCTTEHCRHAPGEMEDLDRAFQKLCAEKQDFPMPHFDRLRKMMPSWEEVRSTYT